MKLVRLILFLSTLLLTTLSWSAPAVELIDGREYPAVLQREIGQAKKSITACLYVASLNVARSSSEPMQIVEALVAARARGVKVEVILDGAKEWRGGEALEAGKNLDAYEYLSGRGLDVFFTTVTATVHAKAVVFDEVSVLSGSTNWSETAFSRNVEINTFVRDPAVAREALAVIRQAGRRREAAEKGRFVSLPSVFLTKPYLGALIQNNSTIDLYLWLLKEASGNESVRVDYERLMEHLGQTENRSDSSRNRIRGMLGRLRSRGLISYETMDLKAPEVRLVFLQGDSVLVPAEYWDWGWARRLSISAKAMYWIGLYHSARSPIRPRWSESGESLARNYGLKSASISNAIVELKRANLLEVDYDDPKMSSGDSRRPNIYTPRPLYVPAAFSQTLDRLEQSHGPEKLARARKYAELIYEDSDPEAIEKFILLEYEYGPAPLEEIGRMLGTFKADNPRRSLAYFITAVKSNAAKGPDAPAP